MRRISLIAVCLVVVGQVLAADTFLHPRLADGKEPIRAIVLLPPTATMKAQGPRRFDFKENEAEMLAAGLSVIVARPMQARGWEVDGTTLSPQGIGGQEPLRWLVSELRERHQALTTRIKTGDVRKGRYSLGDRVARLGSWPESTVLALVHAEGTRKTTGLQIAEWTSMGLFALLGDVGSVTLHLTLVDLRNGDLLCYIRTSGDHSDILKELRKVP
jgi:hypothetical protein